ncbi:MAG: class I SAM-dependent methyltransferase [Cytophagales bacterium]|nr:class I SAM-dependent methyltransferase [Cytophagales bacterium]
MKDRFSLHAQEYQQFRPGYPPALYQFIFQHVKNFTCAWDAGTGNGQAAHVLATRFNKVIATDISAAQLQQAHQANNIFYSIGAEEINQPDSSIDLITVAQAFHWFEMAKFFNCVTRVAKPDGVLAVWGYGLLRINSIIDPYIDTFYQHRIGAYWDAERAWIDDHYRTIPFPFKKIEAPAFALSVNWSLAQLEGYFNTWSAVKKFITVNAHNPVDALIRQLQPHWQTDLEVTFPLFLRMGRVK